MHIDPAEPKDDSPAKLAGVRSIVYAMASFTALVIVRTNATGPLYRILDASFVTMLTLAIMGSALVMPCLGIAAACRAGRGLRIVGIALNVGAIAGFVLLVKWALMQMAP